MVWYSHLSEFPTVSCDPHSQRLWHSLELSYFFDDPADVGNLISGSSAFAKISLSIEVHGSHIAETWLVEF